MDQMPASHTPPTMSTQGVYEPHRGVLILVLGILSIVVCAPIGPFAWVMGSKDGKKIKSGMMDPEGKGLTLAGMICGIVGTVFLGIWILYLVFAVLILGGVAVAGAAGAAGGGATP